MTVLSAPHANPRSRAKPTKAAQVKQAILMFHLGDQAYGLPLQMIRQVTPMAHLSKPPGLPAVLAGFLNLAGTAIPVLRLDRLFESREFATGLYTPLIVLRHPDSHLALLVERVSRIVNIAAEDVLPTSENYSFNDCVEGTTTVDDHVVLVLSPERILLEKEQQCLAEIQDREQSRIRELEEPQP